MSQVNLLEEFDRRTSSAFFQNHNFRPGIKIVWELSKIWRAIYFFFGWTVELQVGENYYVLGRKSLEKMLLRHREEAGLDQIQIDRGSLSWDEVIQATKHLFENERIRNLVMQVTRSHVCLTCLSPSQRSLLSFFDELGNPSQEIRIWDGFFSFVNVNRIPTPQSHYTLRPRRPLLTPQVANDFS
jgi:hypothetical protein